MLRAPSGPAAVRRLGAAGGSGAEAEAAAVLYAVPSRPLTSANRWGVATAARYMQYLVQFWKVGWSVRDTTRLPFIGRSRLHVLSAIIKRHIAAGTLQPRPRGSAANSAPRLGPAELLYLKARAGRGAAQNPDAQKPYGKLR